MKKKPAAAREFEQHLVSPVLGPMHFTRAAAKSYFVAKNQTPALVVCATQNKVGDAHFQIAKAVYLEAARSSKTKEELKGLASRLVAEHLATGA